MNYQKKNKAILTKGLTKASAADAVAVNPKGIKKLLANALITFFIKVNPAFSNGPSNIPKNLPDCIILDN